MSTVNEKMTNIANKIRSKTGTTSALSLDKMVTEIDKLNMKSLVYVGDIAVDYIPATLDLSAYNISNVNEIILQPSSIIIRDIKDEAATEGTIKLGEYMVEKSLSNKNSFNLFAWARPVLFNVDSTSIPFRCPCLKK